MNYGDIASMNDAKLSDTFEKRRRALRDLCASEDLSEDVFLTAAEDIRLMGSCMNSRGLTVEGSDDRLCLRMIRLLSDPGSECLLTCASDIKDRETVRRILSDSHAEQVFDDLSHLKRGPDSFRLYVQGMNGEFTDIYSSRLSDVTVSMILSRTDIEQPKS